MTKAKIKKKCINKNKVIAAALVVLILIIIICLVTGKKDKIPEEISVMLDNEILELKEDVIIDGENIYFSKDDVKDIFDKTIYYNELEKELITTHNTNIALLKVDEDYAEINDSTIQIVGKLIEKNEIVYVPISDLEFVYDIDLNYSAKSNRVIMDSTLKAKTESTLTKRTKLRKSKNGFSKKIEKLIIGDRIAILEEGTKYTKVRTSQGNIGYVKTKYLSDPIEIRKDVNRKLKNVKVYRNYSNISGVYDNLKIDGEKYNIVIPTLFSLEKVGKVQDRSMNGSATYSIYETWVKSNSLNIVPTFGCNANVSETLLSYSQRSQVILSLTKYLLQYNYTMVNIEFSDIDDLNSYYRFIIELTPRLREVGIEVGVTLTKNVDKNRIKDVVDYVFEK